MAVGDDATNAGWSLVPDTGASGRVRYGAREINRTRDYAAQVYSLVPRSPSGYRDASGIKSGTGEPTGGQNGDIYLKIL